MSRKKVDVSGRKNHNCHIWCGSKKRHWHTCLTYVNCSYLQCFLLLSKFNNHCFIELIPFCFYFFFRELRWLVSFSPMCLYVFIVGPMYTFVSGRNAWRPMVCSAYYFMVIFFYFHTIELYDNYDFFLPLTSTFLRDIVPRSVLWPSEWIRLRLSLYSVLEFFP